MLDEEPAGLDVVKRDGRVISDDRDECSGEVAADLELHPFDLDCSADGDVAGVLRKERALGRDW